MTNKRPPDSWEKQGINNKFEGKSRLLVNPFSSSLLLTLAVIVRDFCRLSVIFLAARFCWSKSPLKIVWINLNLVQQNFWCSKKNRLQQQKFVDRIFCAQIIPALNKYNINVVSNNNNNTTKFKLLLGRSTTTASTATQLNKINCCCWGGAQQQQLETEKIKI